MSINLNNLPASVRAIVVEKAEALAKLVFDQRVDELARRLADEMIEKSGLPVNGTEALEVKTRTGHQWRVPSDAVLCLGKVPPADCTREHTNERRVADLLWTSLNPNGKFKSGRAVRSDINAYVMKSLPDIAVTSVSPIVSVLLRRGMLVVADGF